MSVGWLIVLGSASPTSQPHASASIPPQNRSDALPKSLNEVEIHEKLGSKLPLDLRFRNESGASLRLRDVLIPNRPTLLTLNYTSCPMLCDVQLDGLVGSLKKIDLNIGIDYSIITVSIDPNDTPERTQGFKHKYIESYGRVAAKSGWHFLSGDVNAIATLADAVGYGYRYLSERQEYAHLAVAMMLSGDGRLVRYLYGVAIPPQDLRLALLEASAGQIGTPFDRVLLYCFHYDANAGRYVVFAGNLMRLGGAFTLLLLLGFWLWNVKGGRRRPKIVKRQ